jgi:hypothetical protein
VDEAAGGGHAHAAVEHDGMVDRCGWPLSLAVLARRRHAMRVHDLSRHGDAPDASVVAAEDEQGVGREYEHVGRPVVDGIAAHGYRPVGTIHKGHGTIHTGGCNERSISHQPDRTIKEAIALSHPDVEEDVEPLLEAFRS